MASAYTNHYNAKFNKCFFLVRTVIREREKNGDLKSTSEQLRLYDLNDNVEIGEYFKIDGNASSLVCDVPTRKCTSPDDWKAVLKLYMEESDGDWHPI